MISWAMNTVHMVVRRFVAFTMLPSVATISMARKVPSLRGMSGSKNEANAGVDAGAGIRQVLFLKPRICGSTRSGPQWRGRLRW